VEELGAKPPQRSGFVGEDVFVWSVFCPSRARRSQRIFKALSSGRAANT